MSDYFIHQLFLCCVISIYVCIFYFYLFLFFSLNRSWVIWYCSGGFFVVWLLMFDLELPPQDLVTEVASGGSSSTCLRWLWCAWYWCCCQPATVLGRSENPVRKMIQNNLSFEGIKKKRERKKRKKTWHWHHNNAWNSVVVYRLCKCIIISALNSLHFFCCWLLLNDFTVFTIYCGWWIFPSSRIDFCCNCTHKLRMAQLLICTWIWITFSYLHFP